MSTVRFTITTTAKSEWNATEAGTFRGLGYSSFAGVNYTDDHATADYDVEYHEEADLAKMIERLENDPYVVAFLHD